MYDMAVESYVYEIDTSAGLTSLWETGIQNEEGKVSRKVIGIIMRQRSMSS